MSGAVARVLRGEGLASAVRRARERIGETASDALLRSCAPFVRSQAGPLLNVSLTPLANRLGGIQSQLLSRLREERKGRRVVLVRPGAIDFSAPLRHVRSAPHDVEQALLHALDSTGARAVHVEGTQSLPIEAMLRLAADGIRVIVSVHDFSLFCGRLHQAAADGRVCDHARDEECAGGVDRGRRAAARDLLDAASALVFPSRFLADRHRQLFDLPDLAADVIAPGSAAHAVSRRVEAKAVAFAGSVQLHKGAALMPEIVAHTRAEWHAFGGGDEATLRALRRAGVHVHGYYRHDGLPRLLAAHAVGLVVIPSIVAESFALVVSEAWLAGAAVVAFDRGGIAERIRAQGGGWLVPPELGSAGLAAVVNAWREGRITTTIPHVPSARESAAAHLALYQRLGIS